MPDLIRNWAVRLGVRGKEVEILGTVEAQTLREAYLAAIKKFNVPIKQQNRLFVKADRDWTRTE